MSPSIDSDDPAQAPERADERIDEAARVREDRSVGERARMPERAVKPMIIGGIAWVVGFLLLTLVVEDTPDGSAAFGIVVSVVGFAFLFREC